jgi:transposase
MVVLHSAQGFSPPKISDMVGYDVSTVREVIKAWNHEKFAALEPKYGGGRPKKWECPDFCG